MWFRVRATAVLAASFGPVPAAATAGGRGVHNATMADAASLVGTWSPSSALRFFEAHVTRDEARGKTAIVDKLRRAAVDTAGVRLALLFYCRCCEPFVAAQMTALREVCPGDAVVVAAAILHAEDSLPHGIRALVIAGGAGCVFSARRRSVDRLVRPQRWTQFCLRLRFYFRRRRGRSPRGDFGGRRLASPTTRLPVLGPDVAPRALLVARGISRAPGGRRARPVLRVGACVHLLTRQNKVVYCTFFFFALQMHFLLSLPFFFFPTSAFQ